MRGRFVRASTAIFVSLELVRVQLEVILVRLKISAFEELRPTTVKKVKLLLAVGNCGREIKVLEMVRRLREDFMWRKLVC